VSCVKPSKAFKVQINGKEIPVYDVPVAAISSFTFKEESKVSVKTPCDVKWVDVRPLSLGIKPSFDSNEIRFTINEPCKVSVELNRDLAVSPLFLFADPPEERFPKVDSPDTIYFGPNKVHEAGVIRVESGQTVYIDEGAIVEGRIISEKAEDVRVAGRGVLDGTRINEWRDEKKRERLLQFQDCRKVGIEGVTVVNSQTWQIVPINCDGVDVRNVKVVSDNGSDDGVDVVRSRNVKVDDCFIRTKDDCVAIKALWDYPPENGVEKVKVSHSVFWNALWGNGLEIGFELRANKLRDIVFEDRDVIHVERGAVFSIHNGDYATVEDVRYENIRVEDARHKLFDLAIFLSQYSLDSPKDPEEVKRRYLHGAWDGVLSVPEDKREFHATNRGRIRNVQFKDIAVVDGPFPFSIIRGYDGRHLVEDVSFENLTIHGQRIKDAEQGRFTVENARNIKFLNR
jgi:hypothetical protein